ncbi:MAG TPA: ROK family protein [Candidatus Omnitrophota bacterium]|nr:ROK family protein [Candidatus Omnitrophota bacterium]HPN88281.1 ROK family protein [Candidatus Omnitrophota bacterium]
MKNKIFVGFDIGGTKISCGLVTDSGKIIARAKTATPSCASATKIISIIDSLLEELFLSAAPSFRRKDLRGIGLGVPGIVNAKGFVLRTPNMGLSQVDMKRQLEKKFRVNIALGNDVNLGVLGEKWLGAARKIKNVVGLFLGTGLGAGIVINDDLFLGSHGAAAELGHMIIEENGPQCGCGNQGCLESLTGRWAIERDIREAIRSGKKSIITKWAWHKNKPIKSKILREALAKKDPVVVKVMTTACHHLGRACISVRHIFDPDLIVLGGGVVEACADFILPEVKKVYQKDKFFNGLGRCDITVSLLGDDAIILGAVSLVRKK